ncbi:MAG: zf-HC2 domain-containing protein [Frankiaceae bacterium]|nr:zf-HC2 domain-containing protein [Frankiaceae bacterium]MBV9369579.1 zf-HC2 domain-containing protein [Frankiales bacterium]
MTDDMERPAPKFCREARAQLPFLANGELTGWGARVVRAHLKRCEDCRAELARQEQLDSALASLRDAPPEPPSGLLDDLLARARGGSLRERAAVPARGAVSGARPAMSVAFLTVGAAASTGVGYGLYRGARWALSRRR